MVEESHIKEYLNMQHRQYQDRASHAIVTKDRIQRDHVVGTYELQERFPYDENILKYFFKNPKESTILEYGCGPGRNLLRLVSKFKIVAGVDISETNINNAKKFLNLNGFNNIELYTTTGDNIPTESECFDIVFEVICLQHICSYDIRYRILKDMFRVVKKDGIVVVQLAFNNTPPPYPKKYHVGYYENKLLGVQDTNGWCDCCVTDKVQIIKDFESIGLKDIKTWFTDGVNDPSHDKWLWCCGIKK